jgi:amidophosphoribosyltransferase
MPECAPSVEGPIGNFPEVEARDQCAIFGIWAPGENVWEKTRLALNDMQHRGQEASGVAGFADGDPEGNFYMYKDTGLVPAVFGENGEKLKDAPASAYFAVGQDRYGTSHGASDDEKETQPFRDELTPDGPPFVLSHNGQFSKVEEAARTLGVPEDLIQDGTDTYKVTKILGHVARSLNGDLELALLTVLPHLEGAFSLVVSTPDKMFALRDRHGVRPLQLGRVPRGDAELEQTPGVAVASEVGGLTAAGAIWEREIGPGELVIIDSDGRQRSGQWIDAAPAPCVFEYVYLSHGDNIFNGRVVDDVRADLGRRIAKYATQPVTKIVDAPSSATTAAKAAAEATGVPYGQGIIKNGDAGRYFIQPEHKRLATVNRKYSIVPEEFEGEDVAIVDDSGVRGHTGKHLVRAADDAGAESVSLWITSPPYSRPCHLGVDTGNPAELLAARMGGDLEKMRRFYGVKELVYLPLKELYEAVGTDQVCAGCLGGEYAGAGKLRGSRTPERAGRTALKLAIA